MKRYLLSAIANYEYPKGKAYLTWHVKKKISDTIDMDMGTR